MGHEFEDRDEIEIDASPEEVWEAIATGAGMDSWFMGRNEVEPGEGGVVRTVFGGYTPESPVTAWEPGKRFAYRSSTADDGRFTAFEFLIEERDGGGTVLRVVASGFISGEDWEEEYDATTKGGEMFLRTLVEYLTYFPGRFATPITAFGPPVSDWERAWAALHAALGLTGTPGEGDRARFSLDGSGPIAPNEGVVYFVNPDTLGLRTNDALYRFLRGIHGAFVASHHIFAGDAGQQPEQTEQDWVAWLTQLSA